MIIEESNILDILDTVVRHVEAGEGLETTELVVRESPDGGVGEVEVSEDVETRE